MPVVCASKCACNARMVHRLGRCGSRTGGQTSGPTVHLGVVVAQLGSDHGRTDKDVMRRSASTPPSPAQLILRVHARGLVVTIVPPSRGVSDSLWALAGASGRLWAPRRSTRASARGSDGRIPRDEDTQARRPRRIIARAVGGRSREPRAPSAHRSGTTHFQNRLNHHLERTRRRKVLRHRLSPRARPLTVAAESVCLALPISVLAWTASHLLPAQRRRKRQNEKNQRFHSDGSSITGMPFTYYHNALRERVPVGVSVVPAI